MIKLASSTICWARDTFPVALDKARAAGFDAVEGMFFPREVYPFHGDLREIQPAELRRQLAERGLTLAAVHIAAIMTPTEQKRRALTDYCLRAIDVAAELGCRTVVDGGPDRASEPFQPFLRSLEEIVPRLEGLPVRLALENHYGNWIQFIQDYEHIFDAVDSPQLGITLDTGHFHAAGVDPADVARRFAGKVFHVHIKDHRGHESVALGTGETNNTGTLRVLREHGYTGYLSQEIELHNATPAESDAAAAAGLAYLRRLVEEQNGL